MKVSFYNLGCKVNFAEISQIQKQFEEMGAEIVEFGKPCDTVVINTCSVTNMADADCRKIIRRALRLNPNAFVAVIGCYAQLRPNEIAQIEGVDVILGTKYKFDLPILFDRFEKQSKPKIFVSELDENLPYHFAVSVDNESRTRIVLKIQDGCDYPCSYCTIPLARGRSRSLPFEILKQKVQELNDTEYEEVVISGINVGEYKDQSGKTFVDVVRFIEDFKPKQRYRISSIEPNKLKKEIVDTIAKSKIFCPHFHIPLQSGSPEILRAMRRRYTKDYYQELILSIKSKIPHCGIGVDVITGFPGETDEHFEQTYEFLLNLPITYLHVFTYSERDWTPAAAMTDKVPHHIRKERTNVLRKLSSLKRYEFMRSQIGKSFTVIPEEFLDEKMVWRGWTENYIRVEFSASQNLQNRRVLVSLEKIQGETVWSRLLE
ncbi:MAG: tRNA (N(6)-L-threonylcarbamoyladenosine(37)-C(2))-methylthiotransferase MtaB [Ignavibacteria bacterium]|nr:tRNA (N(6)-L-threonylcarbamoyladenosine(37)-C(2))-methylthiotransferase MtaB [Ignavibacteria bacterium]